MNIVDFITARLNDDEKAATAAGDAFDPAWYYDERVDDSPLWQVWAYDEIVASDLAEPVAIHVARHDPARVLREVEAKRAIVQQYGRWSTMAEGEHGQARAVFEAGADGLLTAIRALANVYVDHPDFIAEWRV